MAITESTSASCFTARFEDPDALLAAVRRLRERGVPVLDTYSPFPVHGMDDALGLGHSRITYACGAFAALGLLSAAALQYWTSVIDYPLNVGGKPLNSIPAFIPVAFELTVLFAGLGTVATLFALSRLRPRFHIPRLFSGANDDGFILLAQVPAGQALRDLDEELRAMSATSVARHFDAGSRPNPFWDREVGGAGVAAAVLLPPLAVLALGMAFSRDFSRRVLQFDAGMTYPISAQAFDANASLPGGQVLQHPPQGTLARGQHPPLAFGPGKEEALRAGLELKNPLEPTAANLDRGTVVWNRTCATCHGEGAKGDGPILPKFPNPPNLLIPKYQDYPEGRLFHVATFGGPEKIMKGLADQIPEADRWRAVMHLRALQAEAAKARAAAPPAAAVPAPAPAQAPAPTPAPASAAPVPNPTPSAGATP